MHVQQFLTYHSHEIQFNLTITNNTQLQHSIYTYIYIYIHIYWTTPVVTYHPKKILMNNNRATNDGIYLLMTASTVNHDARQPYSSDQSFCSRSEIEQRPTRKSEIERRPVQKFQTERIATTTNFEDK